MTSPAPLVGLSALASVQKLARCSMTSREAMLSDHSCAMPATVAWYITAGRPRDSRYVLIALKTAATWAVLLSGTRASGVSARGAEPVGSVWAGSWGAGSCGEGSAPSGADSGAIDAGSGGPAAAPDVSPARVPVPGGSGDAVGGAASAGSAAVADGTEAERWAGAAAGGRPAEEAAAGGCPGEGAAAAAPPSSDMAGEEAGARGDAGTPAVTGAGLPACAGLAAGGGCPPATGAASAKAHIIATAAWAAIFFKISPALFWPCDVRPSAGLFSQH